MKTKHIFGAALCVLLACGAKAQPLYDDFNDGVLGTNKWHVETVWYNSEMYETNGEAVFVNAGDLISKASMPAGIVVEGRVRLTGNDHDVFNIRLRSTDDFLASSNCVVAQFAIRDNDYGPLGVNNIAIYGNTGGGMVKASYPFSMNTYYMFKVVDDSTNVTIFIENTNTPVVSLQITNRSGFKIGLNNREGVGSISRGSVSRLDFIQISALSAPPYLTIAVKTVRVNMYVAIGKTYQLQSSSDLNTWNPVGIPFVATATNYWSDFDVLNGQQFFRIFEIVP